MRRMFFVASSIVLFPVLACGVDTPTLGIDHSGTCAAKHALTGDQQAGRAMADKTIALTFDDGPADSTSELSTYLKKEGIKATFFINGVHVDGRKNVVEQQIADGHLLGNHTHTHQALTTLAATDIVDEVEQTDRILAKLVPGGALYFRAPFGDWNDNVSGALAKSAMSKYKGPVGWDMGEALTDTSAADWDCWDEQKGTRTIEQCGDLYVKEIRAKTKGIVLLHDGPPEAHGDKTTAMIKYIVPILKRDGYKFVRVDDVSLASTTVPVGEGGQKPSGPAVDPCR